MEGGKRKRRNMRGNIPQEIVEDILVKLPVKSLVRFKAVSREWRKTIESTYFIEKHIQFQKFLQGKEGRVVLLSSEERYNGLTLENLLFSANGIVPVSPYLTIRSFNRFDGYKISEPCDGLFCLYTRTRIFTLVNPATTSRRRLPDPPSTIDDGTYESSDYFRAHKDQTLLGIGRENSASRRYKLVWFFECDNHIVNKSTRCKVFALDSNTWIDVDPPHCRVHYGHPLIHLDGAIYSFTYNMEKQSLVEKDLKLLAFDLHTQTFQSFPITPDIGCGDCRELGMRVLNHRLCIFKRVLDNDELVFKIWGLDINKRSWEIMYSIDLSCFPPDFEQCFTGRSIIPVATINNYVIITNPSRTIWVLYGSKIHDLYRTSTPCNYMSYFETLVSAENISSFTCVVENLSSEF